MLTRCHLLAIPFILVVWPSVTSGQAVPAEPTELIAAIAKGELERVRWLLDSEEPDAANDDGETALMLAAQAGSFEMCRALLWAGADANAKDKKGRTARDHLKRNVSGFSSVNLLLRAYAFVQSHQTEAPKVKRPNLVMINDDFIDYDHVDLKSNYWVNQAEFRGKKGVDDDHNGFIDDVYGWNSHEDEGLSTPMLADLADETEAKLLKKFVTLYNRSRIPHPMEGDMGWPGESFDDLKWHFENPLSRKIGIDALRKVGITIDDAKFTEMLVSASHGTHVAGIVLNSSHHRAQLHGIGWGRFHTTTNDVDELLELARELAPKTVSYEQFLVQLRQRLIDEAISGGTRISNYLRSVGGGVVNMSWSKPKSGFISAAQSMQRLYELNGMDPKSIEQYFCPVGLDLCGDLALELLVAVTAETALLVHENPNVLFVIAAGNDTKNNDIELPSPAYLSRFFPNVITVASVNDRDELSGFSNFGDSSVQVAAPGEDIRSAFLANQRGLKSGTSMAAPAVSGLAAQIRAEHPELSANDLRFILEKSSRTVDELRDKVSAGGVVDADNALHMAEDWEPGSRADLMLSAVTGPRVDKATDHLDLLIPESPLQHLPTDITAGASANGLRISTIAGFANKWRIVMSDHTGFADQIVHPHGKLPLDWIKEKWKDQWEITSIGGESTDWHVVMSKGQGRPQKLVGMTFDQASLHQFMSRGYRITSVAGFDASWVFVLTDKTDFGEQRFSLPGAFDDKREAWIDAAANEGFQITSLAGDRAIKKGDQDSWVVVLTKDSGLGEQIYTGPGPWPTEWILGNRLDGMSITSVAGFEGSWIVVMSEGTPFTKQVTSDGSEWKDAWIQEHWRP